VNFAMVGKKEMRQLYERAEI